MHDFQTQAEAFAAEIEDELRQGMLNFPTVFDLSMRIKNIADDPDSSLDDITRVVKTEPVLSAKTLRMANTLLLNPYRAQITNVHDAVNRIGISTLRCLAYSVAAEQLAQDHRSRQMRLIASGLWMHSIDVASWAFAFARELRTVHPDTALLAGLMSTIGQFYLLARASAFPALEENVNRFAEYVAIWNEPIGRAVLEVLEVPEGIVDTFDYENPYGGSWPPSSLADTVFLASLAAETPNPFDSLLGARHRPEFFEACTGGIDRAELAKLVESARGTRKELIAAVCG